MQQKRSIYFIKIQYVNPDSVIITYYIKLPETASGSGRKSQHKTI